MRRFETSKDLANEKRLGQLIARALGLGYRKFGKDDGVESIDAVLVDPSNPNSIQAVVEVKVRDATPNQYPWIMLSKRKFKGMLEYSDQWEVPAFFVVEFNDGSIGICRVDLYPNPKEEFGGRTVKTRCAQDIETIVQLRSNWFLSIEEIRKALGASDTPGF